MENDTSKSKKSDKKIFLVLVILAIIVVVIIGVSQTKKKKSNNQTTNFVNSSVSDEYAPQPKNEEFTKLNKDGKEENTSEETKKDKTYKDYTFSDTKITYEKNQYGGLTQIDSTVTNNSDTDSADTDVDIVLFDKSHKEIGRYSAIIPSTKAKEKSQFSTSMTWNSANFYDFEIQDRTDKGTPDEEETVGADESKQIITNTTITK